MVTDLAQVTATAKAYRDESVAPVQTALDAANAEIQRLKALGSQGVIPGGTVNVPANTTANFALTAPKYGLKASRSFPQVSASYPTIVQALIARSKSDVEAGFIPVLSATNYSMTNAELEAAARGINGYFIRRHEPEAKMRSAQYVAEQKHIYTVMKNANPDLKIIESALAYAYRNAAGVGAAGINTGPLEPIEAWDVGDDYRDAPGIDVYSADGVPLNAYSNFRNWFDYHVKTSKQKFMIVEYGQVAIPVGGSMTPALDDKRSSTIALDANFIATNDLFGMWLHWLGKGDQGMWGDDGPKALEARKKAIAATV